ncbi:hypothetical protein [Chryseobacterium nepalense]|uniref:YD repeat-containing protein n=1 Tax=Chryseobacterium nepalense TaxID=1854498 RepID=A0ABY4K964_9FLAO|nr:hypothetical protein [Chryseobacterium nepalense]UPQ77342.1 hypothetical protein M0D58_07255 [Chryseobacterium nepalense]
MKKLQLLLYFLLSIEIFSQAQQLNFGDLPRPIPSTSYSTTYQEMPTSTATGVPNISIPVGGISAQGDKISEDIILSYNPYNVNNEDFVSEVGLGWTLFCGGNISRQIIGNLDELYDDVAHPDYSVNSFNDVYYYTLPNGVSGKFKIIRNTADNTFRIGDYDRNNVKIELTRTSNTATLIVNSFTITDINGYKFVFSDYSQSVYSSQNKMYRSAFYLSSIKDASGMELLTYEYQKNNQYVPGTSTFLYESCKLKKVTSPSLGKIDIEYNYDSSLSTTYHDPYSVSKIKAQNYYGKDLFEFTFEYSFKYFSTLNNQKRVLERILKKNFENPNSPEITRFEYNTLGLDGSINIPNFTGITCTGTSETHPYPSNSVIGLLKKIYLPTGGVTEYEFEPNEYFFDKNKAEYIQSLQENYIDPTIQSIEHIADITYSNTNTATLKFWNLQGDPTKQKRIYFVFSAQRNYDNPFLPENPGNFFARFKINGTSSNDLLLCGSAYYDESSFSSTSTLLLNPGKHNIEFPDIYASGTLSIYQLKNTDPPYKNIDYTQGVRIKKIKNFSSPSSTVPDNTFNYSYNLFDNSNSSSGYKFANENTYTSSEFILYKNVKIAEGENMGYINNYYKLPSDYPDTFINIGGTTVPVKEYYNLTQRGLLDKKSIFDSSNNKVKEYTYNYDLQQKSGGVVEIPAGYGYMRLGIIKKLTQTETDFLVNQATVVNRKEYNYENWLNLYSLSSIKEINADGSVAEKIYSYPDPFTLIGQTNEYQHLLDNNIIGIPVKTVEKANGSVISIIDVKYANNSLYPTSIVSNNAYDGSLKTAIRYDKYDSKGNLLQYTTNIDETTGVGFPTTLVYGYNQSLPIAKIEGATTQDIRFVLLPEGFQGIVARSDQDVDEASEKLLLEELDAYRNSTQLKNFMITTYTYDPLVGVTSVTPPDGIRAIYKYDSNGKLKMVVDVNGNILNEYKYNIKPQP